MKMCEQMSIQSNVNFFQLMKEPEVQSLYSIVFASDLLNQTAEEPPKESTVVYWIIRSSGEKWS